MGLSPSFLRKTWHPQLPITAQNQKTLITNTFFIAVNLYAKSYDGLHN